MHTRFTRRQVSAAMLASATAPALGARLISAQTPAASPISGNDLFAGFDLTPGVAPTIRGDVRLPETVERVVVLTDGAVDAIATIGVQPVGVTESSNFESVAAYLADKISADVTYVGGWGELDLEGIIALEPDVILSDRYASEETFALVDVAPVIATGEIEVPDANALQQWEYEQLVWAHAVGKLDEAKQAILDLRARAAGMQADLGDQAGASVVVFRPQPEFPVVMAQAWITGVMLTWSGLTGNELTLGMEPPHSGDTISLERLDLLDADWLFAATRNAEMSAALETYFENPAFQTIAATQTDQVAEVPGDLWSGATGVLAGHAMLDDIQRIIIDGDY